MNVMRVGILFPAVSSLLRTVPNPETAFNKYLLKQPKCPSVNEWIKKLWFIYTMEY